MSFNLDLTIALLSRTPATLNAFLRELPDEWTRTTEGGSSWSAYDIVGHLIHGDRTDWIPRAKRILEFGETKPFEPFDRLAQERESVGKSLPQLLDEFAEVRAHAVEQLRALNLQPADFKRRGMHQRLGVVTLGQLLSTWATHDLTHLHQLSRVLAHQNREAVGPWIQFLGVLQCEGHSS